QNGEFKIAFAIHPYDREKHTGLPPVEEKLLLSQNADITDNPPNWQPDITFFSEFKSNLLQDCGRLVFVARSLSSKGRYSVSSKLLNFYNTCDLVCVPGEYYKKQLENSGRVFVPIVSCGFTPLDPFFSPGYPSAESFKQQAGLQPGAKIILYAPTWEIELSALPSLWSRIGILAEKNTCLFIKFHPDTPQIFVDAITRSLQGHPRIMIVGNYDILPYLRIADVVVSDASSVWLESISLNKPVVIFDNPNKIMYVEYDRNDPEYKLRDAAIVAEDIEGVLQAARSCIQFPQELSEQRNKYQKELITATDGCSGNRVVEAALKVLNRKGLSISNFERDTAVLLPLEGVDLISETVKLLRTIEATDLPVKFVVLADEISNSALIAELDGSLTENLDYCKPGILDILGAIEQFDFTVILKPDVQLGESSLFRLINHLRRNRNLECVFPLAVNGAPEQEPGNRLGLDQNNSKDFQLINRHVKFAFNSEVIETRNTPRNNIFALRTKLLLEDNGLLATLFSNDSNQLSKLNTGIAQDVVVKFHEAFNPAWFSKDLTPEERKQLESRAQELSEWISGGNSSTRSGYSQQVASEEHTANNPTVLPKREHPPDSATKSEGNLRLALHYERRGKLEEAKNQLKIVLSKGSESQEIINLAKRLGIEIAVGESY
ncbi:CDP-glycerol glycerophosphotransferase family protein, partial [Calditrichota bacterium]